MEAGLELKHDSSSKVLVFQGGSGIIKCGFMEVH